MTQLTIPSLSLFNRSPPKKAHLATFNATRTQRSFMDSPRRSSYLQHAPYIPPAVEQCLNDQRRVLRHYQDLQCLDAYRNAINRQTVAHSLGSYQSTNRQSSLHSFGERRQPCICESPPRYKSPPKMKQTTYLQPPIKPVLQHPQTIHRSNEMLIKDPYLGQREPTQDKHGQNLAIFSDVGKFIKQDTKQNLNKSIMVNDSFRPARNEIQVQTQQPAVDRSSFIISSAMQKIPQFMDQQNFRKTISNLNQQISNLSIDLHGEDIIIDLNDLILTKEQYIEQSRNLLSKLATLSSGKVALITSKKAQGGIVWPEGV